MMEEASKRSMEEFKAFSDGNQEYVDEETGKRIFLKCYIGGEGKFVEVHIKKKLK